MSERTADELRLRLVEIDDELRGLSADEFSHRHELLTESDACRLLLSDAVGPEAEEAAREWADRAARKGSHQEADMEVAKAMLNRGFNDASGHG